MAVVVKIVKEGNTQLSQISCMLALYAIVSLFCIAAVKGQCPWQKEIPDLQTSCICAYNLARELSVQCDQVNFSILVEALNLYASKASIDLLYVNNSIVSTLHDNVFVNLRLHNVQLSSCKIEMIEDEAFRGQEFVLKNLNLQDNLLEEIPIKAIQILSNINLLDLSKNRINFIPNEAFKGLTKLATLKINDNNVTLSERALAGLENSLKNLNLKGTRQRRVPECIRGLKNLAFLDLSLNGIKELPGIGGIRTFEGLDSLTALNLERNLIQNLGETSFVGVRRNLSSLSLLNNLLPEFPVGAIHALKELRVLDIGFNLLTTLPETAFRGNPSITLLALDGNPLPTVPKNAFLHLNSTLRGLSLGGRFLHCDCKLRWVAEWIRNGDLQVTSRERNPQFCGSPNRFRDRGFYSIQPDELICTDTDSNQNEKITIDPNLNHNQKTTTTPETTTLSTTIRSNIVNNSNLSTTASTFSTKTPSDVELNNTRKNIEQVRSTSTNIVKMTSIAPTTSVQLPTELTNNNAESPGLTTHTFISPVGSASSTPITYSSTKQMPSWRHGLPTGGPPHKVQRPPLILGSPPQRDTRLDSSNEVQVKNAYRQDSSVVIQWDSDTNNILGFRVVYRLFGENSFKQGPPLESTEREFKIKNVPAQECIIVCVISLEELHVTPETVPYQQCREVRTVTSQTSNMDKITIAASAAICGTIIVAVIVFIAASKRSRKLQHTHQKGPLPVGGLPVNCCGPPGSPGPIGSIATLSAFNNHKEWDQVSAYSGRSIPRPRIYSMDNHHDVVPSHFPVMSNKMGKPGRSIADGHSQHSFTNNSHRGYLGTVFPTNLVSSRPELRQSRQSLTAGSERMSRASYNGSVQSPMSMASSTRRSRPRSRSRDHLNSTQIQNRPGSRYSTNGSTHTLNNYCDTSDNWTDHDMDIYMARNPTTRNGLVPL